MHLEFWMRTIHHALVNRDPHIRWLFIPAELYDYTIFVYEPEPFKEKGVKFIKATKPDKEFEEEENKYKKMLEPGEAPKRLYT